MAEHRSFVYLSIYISVINPNKYFAATVNDVNDRMGMVTLIVAAFVDLRR